MTKKHFEAFAAIIREDVTGGVFNEHNRKHHADVLVQLRQNAQYAADVIANVASADNPRFDRARFMRACGLEK